MIEFKELLKSDQEYVLDWYEINNSGGDVSSILPKMSSDAKEYIVQTLINMGY